MTNIIRGKLVIFPTKKKADSGLRITFPTKNGWSQPIPIPQKQLHSDLVNKPSEELNGMEVDLELESGQPRRICPADALWREETDARNEQKIEKLSSGSASRSAITTTQQSQQKDASRKIWVPKNPENKGTDTKSEATKNATPPPLGNFHNPYNFVPAPPRKTDDPDLGDMGDLPFPGHGCYHLDRWSGRISVKLKTITPLLILDAAKLQEDSKGHKTYPIRVDAEGKPYLPATSIKGMLRSAYEAVTNSRFSVFEKHDDRLAYRMPARVGPIPARVELKGENLFLRIMKEPNLLGYAGKLLRYELGNLPDKGESKVATRFEGSKDLPQNAKPVWVSLNQGVVERIQPWTSTLPDGDDWKKGWVYITGANIKDKIYERVFIEKKDEKKLISVTEEMKTLWKELILNYQEAHKKDLENRKKDNSKPEAYLGREPGKTAWSYHIYTPDAAELKEGTLCYVEFKEDQIEALIPVSISRRLYKIPPHQLLDKSLQPAKALTELSPADRVFGWVNQKGKGAYKGHLRVSKVQCHPDSEDPNKGIESFSQGLPLAILGQPKPEQARFYVAKNKQGEPLENGSAKEKAYQIGNGLRGRKVYPHHRGLPQESHWQNPTADRTQTKMLGHFKEYRRPTWNKDGVDKTRDDQNRSIEAWVRPEVEFTFNIDISNLSEVELGALLWLLSLPDHHCHRLGGGKPLGFGSVQIKIDWDTTDLRKGEGWKEFYSSLDAVDHPNDDAAIKTIEAFKTAIMKAYGKDNNIADFQKISFIQAFCRCAEGFEDGKPIHYPRISQHPSPEGKAFEWFVQNESKNGKKCSLPKLIADNGLPYSPKEE